MMVKKFFEPYRIQELVLVETGFPPPFDTKKEFGDGREVPGFFRQTQTTQQLIASAQGINTVGQFMTRRGSGVRAGDIVRRVSDDKYFSIEGDPLKSPDMSTVDVVIFVSNIIDRPMQ